MIIISERWLLKTIKLFVLDYYKIISTRLLLDKDNY